MALPAFARQTPLLQHSTDFSRRPTTAQPAARCCSEWANGTDSRTDGRTPYRFIDSVAYYASSVNNNPNEGQMSATVISGGRCRTKGANVVGGALRTFRRHSASSTPHGSRASQTDAVHALYIAATTAPSSFQLQQEREIDWIAYTRDIVTAGVQLEIWRLRRTTVMI